MQGEINFDDCCRMILEDWGYRQAEATTEWREYFRHRIELLVLEFGIAWHDGQWGLDGKNVPHVARRMPQSFWNINGPMVATIEYGYQPGEADLHDRHLQDIACAEAELKQRWVAFLRDLLLLRWPEAGSRTTSWSRLRALGLGERPDTTIT